MTSSGFCSSIIRGDIFSSPSHSIVYHMAVSISSVFNPEPVWGETNTTDCVTATTITSIQHRIKIIVSLLTLSWAYIWSCKIRCTKRNIICRWRILKCANIICISICSSYVLTILTKVYKYCCRIACSNNYK